MMKNLENESDTIFSGIIHNKLSLNSSVCKFFHIPIQIILDENFLYCQSTMTDTAVSFH